MKTLNKPSCTLSLILGAARSNLEWETGNGIIREIILKTGLHDVIMGYPVISMAVMRCFEAHKTE